MNGHSDGASAADQLRDPIRENQRLIAELRRRDEALAAVEALAEEIDRCDSGVFGDMDTGPTINCHWAANRIRAALAAHEQAEEAGA